MQGIARQHGQDPVVFDGPNVIQMCISGRILGMYHDVSLDKPM